jgi:hypothetical protein
MGEHKVPESMQRGGSAWTDSRMRRFLATKAGRAFGWFVFILVIGIGCYVLGRSAGDKEVRVVGSELVQMQGQNQKLTADTTSETATIVELNAKLKDVQGKLEVIMPSQDTYRITPNQALIVADGQLTIALVGSPANQNVTVNINGKQQSAAAGDIITIKPDPSTNCQVAIQSFDMFKAVLTAKCAKGQ